MTTEEAIAILEAARCELVDREGVDEHVEAVQHLITTGTIWHLPRKHWHLQQDFARIAHDMLADGIVEEIDNA